MNGALLVLDLNGYSQDYDINGFESLRDSIAPEIYGHKETKDSIILISSQPRNDNQNNIRNKSNIFLIGDPGVAKSVFGKFVNKITQGSMYVSGSGSSQVGLTATVERIEDNWMIKPGVLPLAREQAVIDELNLISEDDKPKLQEAMSEQRITINKASIHTSLKITCGVFGIANPIQGNFNPDLDLIKQFNLTTPILNRFDLIFVIKDSVDSEKDKKIAEKMLEREGSKIKVEYDADLLKRFFLFIRSQSNPNFSEELNEFISNLYSKIRKSMNGSSKIKINPRFIETIIRLSKASARLRNSLEVSKKDIFRSFEVIRGTYLNEDLPLLNELFELKDFETEEHNKRNKHNKYNKHNKHNKDLANSFNDKDKYKINLEVNNILK